MRRYPSGAELTEKGVSFRVWAPKCKQVAVICADQNYPLENEGNGYFSKEIPNIKEGALYQFRLDDQEFLYPDPASHYQPFGPHGASQIVEHKKFNWSDASWPGVEKRSQAILYEMHIGTFTKEGTWTSACEKLPHLAELGINVIQMMPVAEFNAEFNWGYDGVDLYAPSHKYGTPDDLRHFINQAHVLGIAVILDVVYNHFGPSGNYLAAFSEGYFKDIDTEWGRAINFENPEVRAYFVANAGYWIENFHFDGIRFDACHAILDSSPVHILKEITNEIRKKGSPRTTFVVAENEQQQIQHALPEARGGFGMDAIFNEDFHHSAFVRLVGKNEGYYHDYRGKAQEFVSCIKHGFLYQGQWYNWQKKNRGSPALDAAPNTFINFIDNHDQIANAGGSQRLRTFAQPGAYRTMSALLLLGPQVPLIFQGQEFGATNPFYYFCNMGNALTNIIFEGRKDYTRQFESFDEDVLATVPPPHDMQTFMLSKLNWEEKKTYQFIYDLYKDLIKLRKNDPIFSKLDSAKIDGAVLNDEAFLLRYSGEKEERLLLFNFGIDLNLDPCPEPLIAQPADSYWTILWSSDEVKYGGFGHRKIQRRGNWHLSGNSALVLASTSKKED